MATNYIRSRTENENEYGAGVGRWGQSLLTNRYDDRAHFIFELLQNAEDALARREKWQGSRSVSFSLLESDLRVAHFGKPFDESDVRGVCGIAQSTKDLTAIGRFGIGFKSVYAFTQRPEVHSGIEDFADDEFMRGVILMTSAPKSDAGRFQFFSKFLRAVRRSPFGHGALFRDRGVLAGGTAHALQIDRPRFDTCMEHLARALFFYTFDRKWPHKIAVVSPNVYSGIDGDGPVTHGPSSQAKDLAMRFLVNVKTEGANPEVFEYKIRRDEQSGMFAMAARSYESFEVFAFPFQRSDAGS